MNKLRLCQLQTKKGGRGLEADPRFARE